MAPREDVEWRAEASTRRCDGLCIAVVGLLPSIEQRLPLVDEKGAITIIPSGHEPRPFPTIRLLHFSKAGNSRPAILPRVRATAAMRRMGRSVGESPMAKTGRSEMS